MTTSIRLTLAALTAFSMSGSLAPAVNLPPLAVKTERGWTAYAAAVEKRIAREAVDPARFLTVDFGGSARADQQAVLAGAALVAKMAQAIDAAGRSVDVPDAWVHHWRGEVFLKGVTLDTVMARLQSAIPPSSDVLQSKILTQDGPRLSAFLRVQRTQSLLGLYTARLVYDTDHSITLARISSTRGSSSIQATRILEVEDAGTPSERKLANGDDHGFLLRWNSYWRYQQVGSGVIAECESLSLSRGAPWGTRFMVEPLASSAATESMTRALVTLRDWFASGAKTDRTPRESSPVR